MIDMSKSRYPVYYAKKKPFVEWLKRLLKLKDKK
jgi:hypothetical protein